MRTILILMDSLNRHYLNAYGSSWIETKALDRLEERGLVMDSHFCGSMPCMPARREMMTGRLNFLETPWGPIEPWDRCLPVELRKQKNTYSHMVTDHYHYFHSGGEAYHTLFDSYVFERGQEGDQWQGIVESPSSVERESCRGKGKTRDAYWRNRSTLDPEDELSYSTPRCFEEAVNFVENNHDKDNWHMHLEVFDPHEPFDCPAAYREKYKDTWDKYYYTWPSYARLDPEQDDQEAVEHIRKCYAGSLTMADVYLGKLLDKMDEYNMWDDTVLILTTDHGHLLGEHGYWAKNYMFDYDHLTHIPLFMAGKGIQKGRRQALTASMDLMPTFMELHGAETDSTVHGKSLVHLFDKEEDHHDGILFGYFGKDVNYTDGEYTYCRQPKEGSTVYHHTLMPRGFSDFVSGDRLSQAEYGCFLPSAGKIGHLRLKAESHRHMDSEDFHPLYHIKEDPDQKSPLKDRALEKKYEDKLRKKMIEMDAPPCQFDRLGL
jgi:arylsulfatase A-like enzyme